MTKADSGPLFFELSLKHCSA